MTDHDERASYIEGLRVLAAVLEANPGIPLPFEGQNGTNALSLHFFGTHDEAREQMAAAVRAFPCQWSKSTSGDGEKWLDLNGQVGALHIAMTTYREAVCRRVVTGTEKREVEVTVTPAVTRKVVKEVEVVEWDCGSLLGPKAAEVTR